MYMYIYIYAHTHSHYIRTCSEESEVAYMTFFFLFPFTKKVARNWKRLTSRGGQLSFYLLRGRLFVKFFSDFFLFAGGTADAAWYSV